MKTVENEVGRDGIILSTERITKKFKSTVANDGVSISVPRGKIIGFVGENGSGKTTLIRILTGLSYPTSGGFAFHTEDGKCRVGAVVESPAYQPAMSALDNLRYQARLCGVDEKKSMQVLETVGLTDAGNKKVKHFSLGMKQRLAIGIALMSDPELLILDEPTNGLDPQGIIEMRGFLKRLCDEKKITLLISSHILSELSRLADHYIFIHKGKIVRSVPAEEIFDCQTKQIMFKCVKDPKEFLASAVSDGWADKAEINGDWCVISGAKNYASLLFGMAELEVTDIETFEQTLESVYMKLMRGEE